MSAGGATTIRTTHDRAFGVLGVAVLLYEGLAAPECRALPVLAGLLAAAWPLLHR